MTRLLNNIFRRHFLFLFFLSIICITILIVFSKLAFSKTVPVYVKIKMGQGLWWAQTTKPSIWFLHSLKKGDSEKDVLGRSIAEMQSVRYYPWINPNQYDIYLSVKLNVTSQKKANVYVFKQSTIGVGSPIEINFQNARVSGTIIDLSEKPFKDHYTEKIVSLVKKLAYPWEFDAIKIGETYFDGEETIFEFIDKKSTDTYVISDDVYGNINASTLEPRKYLMVKAKIKLLNKENQWFYGEDQSVKVFGNLYITTNNMGLNYFTVASIE